MYGMIKYVKQQDGTLSDFDIAILENTIFTSINKCNEFKEPASIVKSTSSRITFTVISELEKKIAKNVLDAYSIPVSDIREIVEKVFYDNGYHDTAMIYIKNEYEKIINRYKDNIKELEEKIRDKNI